MRSVVYNKGIDSENSVQLEGVEMHFIYTRRRSRDGDAENALHLVTELCLFPESF